MMQPKKFERDASRLVLGKEFGIGAVSIDISCVAVARAALSAPTCLASCPSSMLRSQTNAPLSLEQSE